MLRVAITIGRLATIIATVAEMEGQAGRRRLAFDRAEEARSLTALRLGQPERRQCVPVIRATHVSLIATVTG